MEDIAPGLIKKIQADFQSMFDKSDNISALYVKVRDGTATYVEANDFAIETGEILATAFSNNLSSAVLPEGKMYYNIAQRIIEPMMVNNYNLISNISLQVQEILNKSANIGIRAIKPGLNTDKIQGIIDRVSSADDFDKVAWVLDEPIKTFSQSIVDDAIRENAEFHSKAGMRPKIVRKVAGNCCEWCGNLAGSYTYPDEVPDDVYRRHQRCRCAVDYNPGNGKIQNVHSKRWKTEDERGKIEARKIVGLTEEDNVIQRNIRENIIQQQNIEKIVDRQQIHRIGTKMYEQRKALLESKGQYGPSYITISDEEVLELVKRYCGKGKIQYDRNGQWNQQEIIITNDKIVGVVFNNQTGKNVATSVFKIHYGKEGVHIVPDYPSKKR